MPGASNSVRNCGCPALPSKQFTNKFTTLSWLILRVKPPLRLISIPLSVCRAFNLGAIFAVFSRFFSS